MTSDVDYKTRTIDIQRNIPSGHNQLEKTTKGKATRRTVDMGKDLYHALKTMQTRHEEQPDPSPWLFHAPNGGPVSYDKIYDDWHRAQELAGIRYRSPHSLRHTYASTSLANGEDLAYIAKQLGHANPEITLAIYTHFLPRKRRRYSNALDRSRK